MVIFCLKFKEDIPMADMAYPEPQPPLGGVRSYPPGSGQNPPPVSH